MKKFAGLLLLALEFVIALVLFAIMVLTGTDVIGRYVFSRPIDGADEMIAAGMAVLIFGSLPIVALRSEHITIDTAVGLLRGRSKKIQERLVNIVSGVALAYLSYRLLMQAEQMAVTGEHSSLLHIPYDALAFFLASMAGIAAALTFVLALKRP